VLKGERQEALRWAERVLGSPSSPDRKAAADAKKEQAPADAGKQQAPAGKQESPASAEEGAPPVVDPALAVTLGVAAGLLDANILDEAETWAKRAQTLAGQLPESGRRGGVTSAQAILAQIYAARSRQATDPSVRRACADQAIEVYRALLDVSPTDTVAANNLACLLQERGEIQEALEVAERLRRGPFSDKARSGDRLPLEFLDTLGTIYRSAGQFDRAAALFQDAAKRYAKEPQVCLHLGRAYAGLRQYPAASAQLNLAASLAEEKALAARDAAAKAKYQAMAAEARRALSELPRRS